MSSNTLYMTRSKNNVSKMRVHDYLYDSVFIVSGARDYARTAFKAAMASAQVAVRPLYSNMFSEIQLHPRVQVVYHPNCRLPDHIDPSYSGYCERLASTENVPSPDLTGKDRFKFVAFPKKVSALNITSPDFHPPPSTAMPGPTRPRNRGTQSIFRESSAQTIPWQPDGKVAETCDKTPEVLYLDQFEWGPGSPYRVGDLPADFHTTEIINKMRHARMWTALVEKGAYTRWMKKRDQIISDVETKDWIFREAEIDELQSIRLELLHRLQREQRQKQSTRTSKRLAKLWSAKKSEMERKLDHIRKTRDREHRKLVALHEGGGRVGLVGRLRAARGHGSVLVEATDPTSDLYAPMLRHGYQARRRHAEIVYDPSLLSAEDHMAAAEPPTWLEQYQNLQKTCSGHHLLRDPTQLCERETKWSDQFLESLHHDLKKARLGAAATTAGPLHVLKPRKLELTPRPKTPEVESVDDVEESSHQAALVLQKIIRGRAVQYLMYEGRTRAAELTEELKTTHGLQREDKIRIAREEAKAREYNAKRSAAEQKDDAVTALVDELCGGAVSAALDFLEKELRRLKEERRQHAFLIVAIREKNMREAAEAGRRQKEEHRRREHDEMFKQVLGVTQETVDAYLNQIIAEGVELAAEEDAVKAAREHADNIDKSIAENDSMSTAEQTELVAELVQQFLLPHAHKEASRHHINEIQNAKLEAARRTIFGLLDEAEIRQEDCVRCGKALGGLRYCKNCPIQAGPTETTSRYDWRWKYSRMRPAPPPKTTEERYPMSVEAKRLMSAIVKDAVETSHRNKSEACIAYRDIEKMLNELLLVSLDARDMANEVVDVATGEKSLPLKQPKYHYYMKRVVDDALERTEPVPKEPCPKELPSEIRQRMEALKPGDTKCYCVEELNVLEKQKSRKIAFSTIVATEDETNLLPSELRVLEDMRKCKCDDSCTKGADSDNLSTAEGTETSENNQEDFEVET